MFLAYQLSIYFSYQSNISITPEKMKFTSSFGAAALLASQVLAHPVNLEKREHDIDTTVLQFALTVCFFSPFSI